MTKLSIIFPVYNVEQYVRASLESIFRQGLDEKTFEVIIINDGTQDNSMGVIADIIRQHPNISVIHQENQGLSVVRNNGIAQAKGEYILMPDSDDLLIGNSLKPLIEKAMETQADMVFAEFLEMTDEDIERFNGECYIWRVLLKRQFLIGNHITFVPGIYYQDVPFIHECCLKAQKCVKTDWLLNIYRRGHESATFSFSLKKGKDFCTVIAKTWELRQLPDITTTIRNRLENDIFITFSMMMYCSSRFMSNMSERMEIIDYLVQLVPDLTFGNGPKQHITSLMLKNIPHTYVRLHHLLRTQADIVRRWRHRLSPTHS